RRRVPGSAQGAGRRHERGASSLEMALIAPGLIFLIFFCVQGALFFYGKSVAIQSAREGVSQLRLAPDQPTYDQIRPEVIANTERFAATVGRESLIDPAVSSSYDDARARVRVVVTGQVISLVPWLDLTITESAEGPVERFDGSAP
ncbi:MAG: TadE/TadG family type IV pilus assembly protein, partial [Nocardioides sp.]